MSIYEIEILRKKHPKKDGRKTMVLPSRRGEVWRRRLPKDIYIQYFDWGAFADGSDVPLTIVPDVVELQTGPDSGFYSNPYHGVNTLTGLTPDPAVREVVNTSAFPPLVSYGDVDFSSFLNASLFASDPETWEGTYREIDDTLAPEYSLGYTGAGGYTAGKGFKVTDGEKTAGAINVTSIWHLMTFTTGESIDWVFTTSGTSECKVTTEQDYSADPVTFTLDASCKVFITPAMTFYWGCATTFTAGPTVYPIIKLLNAIYRPLSRENTINDSNWDDLRSSTGGPTIFKTGLSTGTRNWWHNLATGDPNARMLDIDFSTATPATPPHWDLSSVNYSSPGGFPQNPDAHYGDVFNSIVRPYVAFKLYRMEPGTCLAAIKKGDTWYYVWNTNVISLDNALQHVGGFV